MADWYNPLSWGQEDPERAARREAEAMRARVATAQQTGGYYGGNQYMSVEEAQRARRTAAAMAGRQAQLATGPSYAQAQDARGQQQALAQAYQQAMSGRGPQSVAQAQLMQGRDAAMQQAAALAAAQRGNPMLAARQAQGAQQQIAGQANQQMALLRAQEIAQARAGLGGQLAGMREQDLGMTGQQQQLGIANMQAQLQQQALNDQMQRAYEAQLAGIYGANQQANLAYTQLGEGQNLGYGQLGMQGRQQQNQLFGGLVGAVGAGVAAGGGK